MLVYFVLLTYIPGTYYIYAFVPFFTISSSLFTSSSSSSGKPGGKSGGKSGGKRIITKE